MSDTGAVHSRVIDGLSSLGTHSCNSSPGMSVLSSIISRCQSSVKRCKLRLNCPEPSVMRASRRTVPVRVGNGFGQAWRAELWSVDILARMTWSENLRHLLQMMLVSGMLMDLLIGDGVCQWSSCTVHSLWLSIYSCSVIHCYLAYINIHIILTSCLVTRLPPG